mmetsp:Transcript_7530/g.12655  ORF Transcript_7530/g.12655 Transcript_7530/m.12655 type:complete len:143 (+) Transcript_7530:52-480(+)|eukprot:CAMPEP_0114432894 /NCGR_PEP_ID=MMETSP0103-20121206/11400_1 /TAXON_ID=37642 ORGANISM="Paraphysomonas imperforata, Strain PA2" /NCGR_SAMPLE_ID=MMETSP0103 /ASSEMBLY_ACC=CAM_ASM_000201 /LENGTH=142 /DNA_ID=CAMNT_0001602603 /DNA_START=31 /DNA_END=459 /DNA_ORIENTATION=+
MGIIKSGKVVIMLAGRYAGRKAVVVKVSEDGSSGKRFGNCIVAGIDRYPRKVVKNMGKAKLEKRCKIKPFVKAVNFNHIMPTRYTADFELKKVVDESSLKSESRVDTRKNLKKILEEKYKNQTGKNDKKAGGAQYFFKKLRF